MTPALALALALSLLQVKAASAAQALPLELRVDDCVDVDREELLQLLSVELSGAGASGSTRNRGEGLSIEVTCTPQPEIVRITERRGTQVSTRELDLRAAGQAARRARARELSLLIAESVKARDEPPRAGSSERRPAQRAAVRRAAAKPQPWLELALLGAAEKYTGGYAQLGPTASARLLRLTPLLFEARLGARWAPDLQAPAGRVSTKGWLLSLGTGVDVLPRERAAGLALLARFECDWLFAQGLSDNVDSEGLSDSGQAYLLSLASSAWVRLGDGVRVVAEPALVLPIRALAFDDRGRTVGGLSGLGAAASVGLALRL
jgi:hypothetical protein